MIQLNKTTQLGYTLLLDGNDGENQMLVVMSSGQNGSMSFRFVYAEVDDGDVPKTGELSLKKHGQDWNDLSRRAIEAVQLRVIEWMRTGLPGEQDTDNAKEAVRRFINDEYDTDVLTIS